VRGNVGGVSERTKDGGELCDSLAFTASVSTQLLVLYALGVPGSGTLCSSPGHTHLSRANLASGAWRKQSPYSFHSTVANSSARLVSSNAREQCLSSCVAPRWYACQARE
jgi:hypothetical protein